MKFTSTLALFALFFGISLSVARPTTEADQSDDLSFPQVLRFLKPAVSIAGALLQSVPDSPPTPPKKSLVHARNAAEGDHVISGMGYVDQGVAGYALD